MVDITFLKNTSENLGAIRPIRTVVEPVYLRLSLGNTLFSDIRRNSKQKSSWWIYTIILTQLRMNQMRTLSLSGEGRELELGGMTFQYGQNHSSYLVSENFEEIQFFQFSILIEQFNFCIKKLNFLPPTLEWSNGRQVSNHNT